MVNLQTSVKFLKGVGDKKAETLRKELGIETYEDLLLYYPFRHIDRTKIYEVRELTADMPFVQLRGKLTSIRLEGEKFTKRLVATFRDQTGSVELVWFKGVNWIQKQLNTETLYIVFGKPAAFQSRINIPHPEIDPVVDDDVPINLSLVPVYHTTEKMKNFFLQSKSLQKMIENLLKIAKDSIEESLPEYFIRKLGLLERKEAIANYHFPKDVRSLQLALGRLKFEELFFIQLKLLLMQKRQKEEGEAYKFQSVGDYFNKFYKEHLPFELTEAQKRVIREIRKDMANGQHMNRLLQGDVGSGKTMVAILCMLLAIDNGCQAALMAPTEILANQHFDAIARWLEQMGLTVRLLTGSTRKKMRNTIQQELTDGTLNVLVGTHALIEDKVAFRNLGLVIIDEQHRFGVAQRARLWKKYDILPHVLVMTATPIPRTLAMTIFGDLDVSIIDELPPGRKPIKTVHYFDSQRLRVHALLKQELTKGRQVYIVYPLIEESDKLSYKALTEGVESLAQVFPPPQYAIGVLHGQMKAAEKDLAMQYFVKGITHIMVATTVIEVGVNVPNASVMVIENAEKFGLSQLHQLRGRVGRGADESFCYLMTPFEITREGKKRIETMVNSNDGFEIAEMDLKLRGPGDLEGTQQSGLPIGLKVASLAKDGEILEKARHIAKLVVENDPQLLKPEHQLLRRGVDKLTPDKTMDWAEIS